jgi:formylglycine-generating enzyme required for sulfatase activity
MMNLGKYEILNEIGKGGFGTVYRAKDTVLDREVALKVLKPAWLDDARAVAMFYREARAAARLDHPNIVGIYDMGEIDGRLCIAMRLIAGEPLSARVARIGGQTLSEALPIIIDIAAALDLAHQSGIAHRDIKPSNILIRKDGRALLTDFGLVRGSELATMATSSAGAAMGTPPYIAPEIWEGKGASAASDVYALACVVYEMLTGVVLFAGNSTPAVMRKHFAPPDLSRIADPAVARALASAMHPDPAARSTAKDLVAQLKGVAPGTIEAEHGREDDIATLREAVIAAQRERLATALKSAQWAEARQHAERLRGLVPGDVEAAEWLAVANREIQAVQSRTDRIAAARRGIAQTAASSNWPEMEQHARELATLLPGDPVAVTALERASVETDRVAKLASLRSQIAAGIAASRWAEVQARANDLLNLEPRDPAATDALARAQSGLDAEEVKRRLDALEGNRKSRRAVLIVGGGLGVLGVGALGLQAILRGAAPPVAPTASPQPTSPTVTAAPAATPSSVPPTRASATATSSPTTNPAVRRIGSDRIAVLISPALEMDFIRVPAGEFLMGSDRIKDPDAFDDELPQHKLALPEYWIGATEVTVAQFAAFVKAAGYKTQAEKDFKSWTWTGSDWKELAGADWAHPRGPASGITQKQAHPVVNVSWYDALAYCAWVSKPGIGEVSLPSEAEWEKAARGSDGRTYPWGNEAPDPTRLNFGGNVGDTTHVQNYGARGESPYACADMAGNVWEWTRSLWGQDLSRPEFGYPYSQRQAERENMQAGREVGRVLRGGSFVHSARFARCANRFRYNPDLPYDILGFRVILHNVTI